MSLLSKMLSINWISPIVLNVLGEVHLQTLATLSKRTIILYSSSGEKTHIHPCVNNKSIVHRFSLLEMKLKDQTITSFLPLVDCFLVGRGQKFFDRCGAKTYGVCQGEFGGKVSCSTCGQKYHKNCVEISMEPFNCGCHIPMPYQLKE